MNEPDGLQFKIGNNPGLKKTLTTSYVFWAMHKPIFLGNTKHLLNYLVSFVRFFLATVQMPRTKALSFYIRIIGSRACIKMFVIF